MKATSITTALVAAAAGVNAQNSSSTMYVTEYYNSCDSTSTKPTMTATELLTYCPICEVGGMSTFEGGSFTIYETVYSAECSTGGFEDKTYTVTEPCPSSGLDRSAGYVPQGFTTTTMPCGCAENTPVPITAPIPALASATALPTISVMPTPPPAKNAAGPPAAAPAPTSPAGTPATSGPGAPVAAPAGDSPPAPANAAAPGPPAAPAAAPNTGNTSPAPANAAAPESPAAPAAAPDTGNSSPAPAPAPAAAAGSAPATDSPGSPGSPGSSTGAPAEAPAAVNPASPAGSQAGGVAPSSASGTNSTVPFTGAATYRVPSMKKAIAGLLALISAFAFVQ